jgi:hypothetical protein
LLAGFVPISKTIRTYFTKRCASVVLRRLQPEQNCAAEQKHGKADASQVAQTGT